MEDTEKKSENKVSPVKYFIAGGFGGICTVVSGHPLDTIKVRLQTMAAPKPGEKPLYTGTFDCARKTVRLEGIRGLYKGMSAPLTGVVPIFAISFLGFGIGKKLQQKDESEQLGYPQLFLAGAFSGLCTSFIMAPGERLKCLLQIQQGGGPKKYNGLLDCAKKVYKEGGLRSVYRGTCATLLRDVPGSGVYFLVYEAIQNYVKERTGSNQLSLLTTIFAGGMAGISLWIIGMPPDVLKSRYQTAPEGKYRRGIRSVFVELMAKEGPMALYKGVTPVMLRAFPANAACFIGFEICMKFLNTFLPSL